MGATGGFPIDLVLFGMIAAFLVLRLRSILGKRQGFERPAQPVTVPPEAAMPQRRTIDAVAEPATARALPDANGPVGLALGRMMREDTSVQPQHFLDGAEAAFRMIVTAFAAGNRDTLRPLLSPDTFAAFDAAIGARDAAGHTQTTEIRAIPTAEIVQAELSGSTAAITVRFVSDQVSVTHDGSQLPVAGTDAVTEISDLWTFERDLASSDPTWRLVAARSA